MKYPQNSKASREESTLLARKLFTGILFILFSTVTVQAKTSTRINIQGSSTVNPVVAEAAEILAMKHGWKIYVDIQGGSSAGISSLGEGLSDIGMSSKPLTDEDIQRYPNVDFRATPIGIDGVALVVSEPIWASGIHALTKTQVQSIYKREIRNWAELGGPDLPILFYNKEPGYGTWEVFADWAFDGHKNAPLVSHLEVGSNEEARNKVAAHSNAITQLSASWANSPKIKVMNLINEDQEIISPSPENIQSGIYPMVRLLYLITDGPPQGVVQEIINFILSPEGQTIVEKYGYLKMNNDLEP